MASEIRLIEKSARLSLVAEKVWLSAGPSLDFTSRITVGLDI